MAFDSGFSAQQRVRRVTCQAYFHHDQKLNTSGVAKVVLPRDLQVSVQPFRDLESCIANQLACECLPVVGRALRAGLPLNSP